MSNLILRRRIADPGQAYRSRRAILYAYTVLLILSDRADMAGRHRLPDDLLWAWRALASPSPCTTPSRISPAGSSSSRAKPFKVGDRIQIGETAGDVIDIRFFQFSVVEIGNWVDADQSTGRIVHVPNSKVLRDSLANYHIGFEYIWNEIPVLITFESDWKKAKGLLETIAQRQRQASFGRGAGADPPSGREVFDLLWSADADRLHDGQGQRRSLTVRYLVNPRQRRTTEQQIWEATLDAFARADDIELAYPTTRFYSRERETKDGKPKGAWHDE